MTNFIFKSPSDLQKISQSVKVLLNEQRLQRADLAEIKYEMKRITNQFNLESTVKGYYSDQSRQGSLDPED